MEYITSHKLCMYQELFDNHDVGTFLPYGIPQVTPFSVEEKKRKVYVKSWLFVYV